MLMATSDALDPQEAMFEPPATQVILDLVQHEMRKAVSWWRSLSRRLDRCCSTIEYSAVFSG